MLSITLIILLAYLTGSISPSILISRWVKGKDVRDYGSGNAGLTNAFRMLGLKWGIVILLSDFGKGLFAAMVIPSLSFLHVDLPYIDETLLRIIAASAVVLGHVYPIFFGFRGGKGVLTLAGAVVGIAPFEAGLVFAMK